MVDHALAVPPSDIQNLRDQAVLMLGAYIYQQSRPMPDKASPNAWIASGAATILKAYTAKPVVAL